MKKHLALLLTLAVLAACSKKEDAEEAPLIEPANVTEQSVDGFRTARLHKGAWRPTITCTGRDAAKTVLTADLWEHTLSRETADPEKPMVFTSPELVGKPLGTERTWTLSYVPTGLAGFSALRLQIDRFGRGHVLVSREGRWSPQFDCQERAIPYEHKFIEAACSGDTAFVENFLENHGPVGVYVNQIGVLGETALTCAMKNGRDAVVELLLNRQDGSLDFNAGNLDGQLPLFLDLDGRGRYAAEWLRLPEVDLNRLDGNRRTIFHTTGSSLALLKATVKTKRLNPGLLNRQDSRKTTALGALIERSRDHLEAREILTIAKSLLTLDAEAPAIANQTLLEYAVARQLPHQALLFLNEKPLQRLRGTGGANALVPLAAASCDAQFVKLLDQRRDVVFTTTNGAGENAVDVVRRLNCADADRLIELFVQRGVADRLDPATPACAGDAAAFARTLANGGARVFSKTTQIMTCIWDKPEMLQVMARQSTLPWDWSVVEGFAQRAIDSRDARLTNVYLNDLKWPAGGAFFQRLRDNLNAGTLSLGQYFDAVSAQNALTDANLRVGAYGHLLFDLIQTNDHARTSAFLQKVAPSAWPVLDPATRPEIQEFYTADAQELIAANGCVSPRLPGEGPLLFALRLQNFEAAKNIAAAMRQRRAPFGSQKASCANAVTLSVMNPLFLAVKQCQPEVVRQAYDLGTTIEGAGSNKMTRRNAWDVLARSACSADQAPSLIAVLANTVGDPSDKEIAGDGPLSSTVAKYFTGRGYAVRPVLTPFLALPKDYPGLFLESSGSREGSFQRRDGRVVGGMQAVLKGSGPDWSGYQISRGFLISFAGLSDHVVLGSYTEARKKGNCLVLVDGSSSSALVSRDGRLAIEKVTVCPTTLRFKFNPTTGESSLPIRNHVNGDFTFSLEGLSEDTGN